MSDQDKTRQQLLDELGALRQSVAVLEAAAAPASRAEEAVRQSEAKYKTLVETSPDAVIMADLRGHITLVSPRTLEMHGSQHADELLGRNALEFIAADDHPRFLANLRRTVDEGLTKNIEYSFRRRDGTHFAGEISAAVIKDLAGRPQALVAILRDISQRKAMEEALRQSERRFRNYFQQGLIGMAVTSVGKRWLEVNDRMCEIMGRSREELLQCSWADVTHPDDLQPNLALYRQLLNGEIDHYTMDKRFFRKDGRLIYATIHIRAFRNADGSIDHCVSLTQDITARKMAEQALQASEDRYRSLFNSMTEGFALHEIVTDSEGRPCDYRYLDVNPAFERLTGRKRSELIGRLKREVTPGEDDFWIQTYGGVALGGPPARFEHCAPGSSRHWQVYAFSPAPRQFAVLFTDITQRKRAEGDLRQTYEELRAIYDSLGDGLIIAQRETLRVVRANASIRAMLGYTEPELLALPITALHPPEAMPGILQSLDTSVEGHLPAMSDVPVVRKDGSIFYADITGDSLTYQGQRCCLGVFRDVSGRRQAQEALARERRSLENMLEASDQERRTISYEIHDGLAQYLAAANMQLQSYDSLRENSSAEARQAYQESLELVRRAHAEARRLINDLRPPVIDETGLEGALGELVDQQRQRGGPEIQLHFDLSHDRLPAVLENALFRIVQEALTNACKYSQSQRVAVSLAQQGAELRLEVRDWGIGFAPETIGPGHFGLEGVRQRARLLGGRVTIDSQPGRGTALEVVVPVVDKPGGV